MVQSTRNPVRKTSRAPLARLHLRIHLGPEVALGPGKADLLEGIEATGSIAAAGRQLGMSYKRAWVLVDTMNACFRTPLVAAAKGGKTGGGAALTPLGAQVLTAYRRMQERAARAVTDDVDRLRRHLLRSPRQL
ncbi:MAG: LysR family transcriptional regulator [Betaproteobacteria bacterium]|nr:LysR family transcriptional regulator [Betaproteobacteria bacterium]